MLSCIVMAAVARVLPTPEPERDRTFHEGAPDDLSQHVVNAVVAHVLRWQRPPRVLIAASERWVRLLLGSELRDRGLDVVELEGARALHAELVSVVSATPGHPCDVLVVDARLTGCSPLHAIAYARSRGMHAPVVLLADDRDPAMQHEAGMLDLDLCPQGPAAFEAIDRALLRALRRRWSERPAPPR